MREREGAPSWVTFTMQQETLVRIALGWVPASENGSVREREGAPGWVEWQSEKTDPFSARLPHQNILPFPEADRREAEEKKIRSFKMGQKRLKIGQI